MIGIDDLPLYLEVLGTVEDACRGYRLKLNIDAARQDLARYDPAYE